MNRISQLPAFAVAAFSIVVMSCCGARPAAADKVATAFAVQLARYDRILVNDFVSGNFQGTAKLQSLAAVPTFTFTDVAGKTYDRDGWIVVQRTNASHIAEISHAQIRPTNFKAVGDNYMVDVTKPES